MVRDLLADALTALVVVVVLAMVLGQLLGQPVVLGYVTSGSMEPTLDAGDGFVAVPSPLAGDTEPGDVVVFRARTVQDGGLTTHRVVEETPRGYVTKGDANPFTDQDGGEPPVTEDQVVAHALQVGGSVVAIPALGTAIETVQGLVAAPFGAFGSGNSGTVLVFGGIALFVLAGALDGGRPTDRETSRENVFRLRAVVLGAAVVVTAAATAAMVVPAGTHEVGVVVTDQPTDDPQVVAPGGTATVSYGVHNGGVVPTLVVSEPVDDGVTAIPRREVLGFDQRAEVDVRVTAPDATGEYRMEVRESRYLLLLPRGVLEFLHDVHPSLALLAVEVTVATFVVTASVVVFGTGYLRIRSGPGVPLRVRLRRRWRRFRR